MEARAIGLDVGLQLRAAGLEHTADRWGRLASFGALAYVAMLYASPTHWFPVFEAFRLGVLSASICAGAVIMRRVTSGEPIRLGGATSGLLFVYLAVIPLSLLWTIHAPSTLRAISDAAKLLVVFVALQNALDTRARLRTFFAVASLASIA